MSDNPDLSTLSKRMRDAAELMEEVNQRFIDENPGSGFSKNEPISPNSMRALATRWSADELARDLYEAGWKKVTKSHVDNLIRAGWRKGDPA
jgi:hypothetical protein